LQKEKQLIINLYCYKIRNQFIGYGGALLKMLNLINKHKLSIIGITLGAIGGFAYYYFVGCASGTCAITSKPSNSTLYGALLGGLFLNIFKKEKK
jgi:hypothetical protein